MKEIPTRSLKAEALLRNIQELLYCLTTGNVPEYPLPPSGTGLRQAAKDAASDAPGTRPIAWRPMTREDTARFNTAVATQLKLLGKVMPDLKAIDFTDHTPSRVLDPQEIAQRLRGLQAMEDLTAANQQARTALTLSGSAPPAQPVPPAKEQH